MPRHIYLILSLLLASIAYATPRKIQYTPDTAGWISCHNGENRYTRALYGSPTLWRLETSDRPIFGAYHKKDNRNIHFTVTCKGKTLALDSAANCSARYRGGVRDYRITDPSWGKGEIYMQVMALPDYEGAIWKISATKMPKGSTLTAHCCATVPVKISRSGDLGVDPDNCFDPHPGQTSASTCTIGIAGNTSRYMLYSDREVTADTQSALSQMYEQAAHYATALGDRIKINTPDPYINTLGATLSHAAEGIWDGETYQHGAVGWRMPLSGWRGAYAGDFLGWHDRARTHFTAYSTSQVTDVEPVIPHPTQDPVNALARAEKRWGTQMYSDGYICRNPGRNDQMHHYDMNLCYIDELLWHMQWTGDEDYARQMWPVLKRSLEWEKRNFDPDDDGLYDAYCCIWASDALYYDGGAVTHSSAYNYRANRLTAQIASIIGEDPAPYQAEAEKIKAAIKEHLWLKDQGVWAESRDRMGHQMSHTHPGVWTIYHAIDSDISDPIDYYLATEYITNNIPHIPVESSDIKGSEYEVISTTDWMPYTWSINNVAFAEIYHTALAYWQAGRATEAFMLMKSAMLDGMFLGRSPGNIGQISHYDAARGECYRDFADPVGVLSRTVVQGLFGFTPEALSHKITLRPGWPREWQYANIHHPDFTLQYSREGSTDTYLFSHRLHNIDTTEIVLNARRERVAAVRLNGKEAAWSVDLNSVGHPAIRIAIPANTDDNLLEIEWDGAYISNRVPATPNGDTETATLHQGDMTWIMPTGSPYRHPTPTDAEMGVKMVTGTDYTPVDLSKTYNANVTDIFRNKYLTPRPPYTTLQLPVQGIGEWCHPNDTAHIDDRALRGCGGEVKVADVPFRTPATGHNAAYVTLFDNYPDSIIVPLSGQADGINLLLAGSTNHMQCYMPNATATVTYTDGTTETLSLVSPYNWCPIEQEYYVDGKAFAIPTTLPWRLTLKDGAIATHFGDNTPQEQSHTITPQLTRTIDGGAAVALGIRLDPTKPLKEMCLQAQANDVVIGLLSATLVNNPR